MPSFHAPAWQADWLNGWLAAIGVVAACEHVCLSWSHHARPHAIFQHAQDADLFDLVARGMLPADVIERSAARHVIGQNPTEEQYETGSCEARTNGDWLWSALFTDLGPVAKLRADAFDKSRFYPGMPGKMPIAKRLSDIAKESWADPTKISESMLGRISRMSGNGLAFDQRRLFDPAYPSDGTHVDPVVEALAFHALVLFPVRGDVRRVRTRGEKPPSNTFKWRTWRDPLDLAGIDAVLDLSLGDDDQEYELVHFRKKSSSEATSGYFSRLLK